MLLPFTNSFSCFSFDVVKLGSFSCYSSVVYVHIVVIHFGTFLKFFCRLNSYCCSVFTLLLRVSMFMSSGYVVVSSCHCLSLVFFPFFFPPVFLNNSFHFVIILLSVPVFYPFFHVYFCFRFKFFFFFLLFLLFLRFCVVWIFGERFKLLKVFPIVISKGNSYLTQ